jgi:hypothetical protein
MLSNHVDVMVILCLLNALVEAVYLKLCISSGGQILLFLNFFDQ